MSQKTPNTLGRWKWLVGYMWILKKCLLWDYNELTTFDSAV